MEVNDALVDNLSNLARLKFEPSERAEILRDLQGMISFVDKLNELRTEGVEPLMHMSGRLNILREDIPGGSVSREEALGNAPQSDGSFFRVPKVISNPSK